MTRFAHAAPSEVALAAGEPPVARGYTPSVFSEHAKAAGGVRVPARKAADRSRVSSRYCVDGDDHNDPVADRHPRGRSTATSCSTGAIADQARYPQSTC